MCHNENDPEYGMKKESKKQPCDDLNILFHGMTISEAVEKNICLCCKQDVTDRNLCSGHWKDFYADGVCGFCGKSFYKLFHPKKKEGKMKQYYSFFETIPIEAYEAETAIDAAANPRPECPLRECSVFSEWYKTQLAYQRPAF